MEWVKTYVNCIHLKQITTTTFLLQTMCNRIDKTMNTSDEVWMWVYQKYGMSQIIWKLYSVKTKNFFYIAVTKDGRLNLNNGKTNYLQYTSSKIMMIITMIFDSLSINGKNHV